jgi:hypothetical protein
MSLYESREGGRGIKNIVEERLFGIAFLPVSRKCHSVRKILYLSLSRERYLSLSRERNTVIPVAGE